MARFSLKIDILITIYSNISEFNGSHLSATQSFLFQSLIAFLCEMVNTFADTLTGTVNTCNTHSVRRMVLMSIHLLLFPC